MKNTRFYLVITILLSSIGFAQSGINYKALIRDGAGIVVSNQAIDLEFTLLQSQALTQVYQETHNLTTDQNGILIAIIGTGNSSDNFQQIDWSAGEILMNVKVDVGEGWVDMGTTEFQYVPFAYISEKSKSADNVSGLELLNENSNEGWRIIGRDPEFYGDIGESAVDLSTSFNANMSTFGATGDYSLAAGLNSSASGNFSMATGQSTIASGGVSTALGIGTIASGSVSTAMGSNTLAEAYITTAIGRYNIGGGTPATWEDDDSLFEIGNGSSNANRSNALTILKDGTILQHNSNNLYDELIGIGSVAFGVDSHAAGDYSLVSGFNNETYSPFSVAIGSGNTASGNSSIAAGENNVSSGMASVALVRNGISQGDYSFSVGNANSALGNYSIAMGSDNYSWAEESISIGIENNSRSWTSLTLGSGLESNIGRQVVLGRFNEPWPTDYLSSWASSLPLLVVGNGTSDTSRSNALTVLGNGFTGIGTDNPQERLHISNGRLRIGSETIEDTGSNQLSFNASLLPDLDNAMRLGNSSNRWLSVWAADGTINTSDRREKKNIETLTYGLKEVLKMKPVSFNWKNPNNPDVKLGLIAQDVQELIPEVVKSHIWETDEETGTLTKKDIERLGVYYSDLVPVLIKAIQEQQKIIESEKQINKEQSSQLQALLSRIEILESKSSNQ